MKNAEDDVMIQKSSQNSGVALLTAVAASYLHQGSVGSDPYLNLQDPDQMHSLIETVQLNKPFFFLYYSPRNE